MQEASFEKGESIVYLMDHPFLEGSPFLPFVEHFEEPLYSGFENT